MSGGEDSIGLLMHMTHQQTQPHLLQLRIVHFGACPQRVHHFSQQVDRLHRLHRRHMLLRWRQQHQQSLSLVQTRIQLLVQNHLRQFPHNLRIISRTRIHLLARQLHLRGDELQFHHLVRFHHLQKVLLHQLVAQRLRVVRNHLIAEECMMLSSRRE